MKKIFRISVVIACLLIMTLAVVGCKPAEEDKMVIGFLSGIYEIQWEQDMEKELKKFAEEEDATIITMDSHLDPADVFCKYFFPVFADTFCSSHPGEFTCNFSLKNF